ncbi:MAG TPA: hypothetical protein VJ851_17540 [Jatrophihabitans sp.]|nr:hypothetical protein [Jatrophihabitans sp.]
MNVMRHRGPARVLAGVITSTGLIATTLVYAAAPAVAAPAPYAGLSTDLGITAASSMVITQGKLFIGTGNSVQVRSLTGQLISTITGEMGVAELLSSPDGSTVYAADAASSAISKIDAATGTETAHWTVDACPIGLALSDGRLFYSYGCANGSGGLASIDAGTGADHTDSGLTFAVGGAPVLAGVDGRLVTRAGYTVTSYSVSGATVTAGNSMSFMDSDAALTISPDGKSIALTNMNGYQLSQYDAVTLTQAGNFVTGHYPDAVAYNSTSDRIVGGAGTSDRSTGDLIVFDSSSGSELAAASADGFNSTWLPNVLPSTLTFGPDLAGHADALVYALAAPYTGAPVRLIVGPTSPLTIAHMTLTLGSPKAWGQPLVATVNFPGHPNTALTLKVLPNSGSPIYVPVRTNQWGVLVAKVGVNFTGRVYAYYGGDLMTRHEAPSASAIQSYTVPTRTTASVLGAYKTSGGVLFFRSAAYVQLHIAVAPPHVRTVAVTLQAYAGGRWVTRQATSFTTNKWGTIDLALSSSSRNVLLRTIVVMPTTVFNTGSSALTRTFEIG